MQKLSDGVKHTALKVPHQLNTCVGTVVKLKSESENKDVIQINIVIF